MSGGNRYSTAVATAYHATHAQESLGDEEFYVDLARDTTGRVLEAACGTGRIYLELLREGVVADGFDISRPMLELLCAQAADIGVTPTVWQANLQTVGATALYNLILIPYNSFATLTSVDAQLRTLDVMYETLQPGGQLVFDVFVPRYDVIADSFGEWHSHHTFQYEGREHTSRTRTTLVSQPEQTYCAEREIRDDEGTEIARDTFTAAHLPPQQVELLARHSPFDRWTVHGAFNDRSLEDGDAVQRWHLHKAP